MIKLFSIKKYLNSDKKLMLFFTGKKTYISGAKKSSKLHSAVCSNIKKSADYKKLVRKVKIKNNVTKWTESKFTNIESQQTNIDCIKTVGKTIDTHVNTTIITKKEKELPFINYTNIEDSKRKRNVTDNGGKNIKTTIEDNFTFKDKSSGIVVTNDLEEMSEILTIHFKVKDYKIKSERLFSILKNTISSIIDIDVRTYKNIMMEDIATYFSYNDCLSKYNWPYTESMRIEELVIKIIEKFNNTKNNMGKLTSSFVYIFYNILKNTSTPSNEINVKYIKFINIMQEIICYYDKDMWNRWIFPSLFLDWCFVLAFILIKQKNEIEIKVINDMSLIRNALIYCNTIKNYKYKFMKKNNLRTATPNRGIYEFTRSKDVIKFDELLPKNNELSKINTNKPEVRNNDLEIQSTQIKHKNVVNEIYQSPPKPLTILQNILGKKPIIAVRKDFSVSNSFKNKLICYEVIDD